MYYRTKLSKPEYCTVTIVDCVTERIQLYNANALRKFGNEHKLHNPDSKVHGAYMGPI